jgi:Tol biopolymer transport system component
MQRLTGGDPVRLTTDKSDDREPAFSSDGSRIAFRSERDGGGVYVMPAHSSGEATRLAGGGAYGPRFSPDGRWLAYSTGAGRFNTDRTTPHGGTSTYLMPSTGGQSRQLLPGFLSTAWPVWSPDGRHLLVTATEAGNVAPRPEWWVIALDGQTPATTGIQVTGGFAQFPSRAWSWNAGNRIVYSAALGGDSWNLWEIVLSPGTWKAAGEPRSLTTGADLQAHAAVARGKQQLVFASLVETVNVWSVPLEPNSGRVTGPPQRVTATAARQLTPSTSDDGRFVAFRADKPRTGSLWIRDLEKDRETFVVPSAYSPTMAPDGSRVAFVSDVEGKFAIYAAPTAGGVPEKVCADCSPIGVHSWSKDRTRMLYLTGSPVAVWLLDLRSGTKKALLVSSHDLWQPKFSPDQRWVSAVEVSAVNRTQLWIAPFSDAPSRAGWVQITNGEFWDDKPRWSPDGSVLYFTSLRDGFHCLWAQRLQPDTKQPIGPPFPLQHFHSARLSMNNTGFAGLAIAVARDRIFVNLGEVTGNIWTTRLR